ncbi:MAG: hypothetical protein GY754_39430 [bacterium]|nr:hypothetical protein [bacterium]
MEEKDRDILEELKSIPRDRVKAPRAIPVGVYVQEAENLYHWCLKDKEILLSKGLNEVLIEDLPKRYMILLKAEGEWAISRKIREGDQERRDEELPAAFKLKNKLQSDFRFAYRNIPELMKTLRHNGKSTNSGVIQELNDLSVLGKDNPEPLKKIGFDMEQLEKAAETSSVLGLLLAETSIKQTYLKDIRDRAYTYLKEAVDEIRNTGKYAFQEDKKRQTGYISQYLQRRNRKYSQKKIKSSKKQQV